MPSSPKVNRNEAVKRRIVRTGNLAGTNVGSDMSMGAAAELRKMGLKKSSKVYGTLPGGGKQVSSSYARNYFKNNSK